MLSGHVFRALISTHTALYAGHTHKEVMSWHLAGHSLPLKTCRLITQPSLSLRRHLPSTSCQGAGARKGISDPSGEGHFSWSLSLLKLQRWQCRSSNRGPTTVTVVSHMCWVCVLLCEAPSHPFLFRASLTPVRLPEHPLQSA